MNTFKEKAFLLLLILSLIWGYNWVVMKQGIEYIPALYFVFLRCMLGGLVLFAVLAFKGGIKKPKNFKNVFILGILQTGFLGLAVLALIYAKAGKTAILVYSMPFWLMFLSWWFLSQKPDKKELISNAFAFAGLIFILEPWRLNIIHINSILGDALAILSGIFWAFSVIWQKTHKDLNENLLLVNAWQMFLGSFIVLIAAVYFEPFQVKFTSMFVFTVLYNAILGNAIAFLILSYAVKKLPSGIMGLTMLFAPIVGMVSAMLILNEQMNLVEIIGSVLIIAGLFITALDHIKRQTA